MKGKFNKWFKKKKSVRVFYVDETRHLTEHWLIPEYGQIHIHDKRFCLTDDERLLSKGVPTFVCSAHLTAAVQIPNPDQQSYLTPDQFDTAISSKVSKDILESVHGNIDKGLISMILGIITLVAVGALAYFVFENITIILDKINQIDQILRNISGGA